MNGSNGSGTIQTADLANYSGRAEHIADALQEAETVIADALNALQSESDPDQRREIAAATYQWCAYVTTLASEQQALTGAAAAVAVKAIEQRDEAIRALEELVEAVEQVDTDHPLVGELAETIEENALEWAYNDVYNSVSEAAAEEMIDSMRQTLALDWWSANDLYEALQDTRTLRPEQIDHLIAYLQALREAQAERARAGY